MDEDAIWIWYTRYILCISFEYNIYIICIWVCTQCKTAATIYFHQTSVYAMYIPCIYLTYTVRYTVVSVFHANWVCAILLCWPSWTRKICICVCRWVSAPTNILFNSNVYVVDILCIHNIYTMYILPTILWYTA